MTLSLLLSLSMLPAAPAQQEEPAAPAESEAAAETSPLAQKQKNPRRADSYSEALGMAGDDGVAVFCYGPDWNQRSVRMLKKFWQTAALEEVSGGAILVAAPYYQVATPEQEQESRNVTAGMPAPPFGVCPTVMLFDKDGFMYANLPGTDYLGDEEGKLGMQNIHEKIAHLRKRNELLKQAENLNGAEKAKVLGQVADLPIKAPRGLVDMIEEADPQDSTGLVRRNKHNATQFLYTQMETKDGFLAKDFEPDYNKIKTECMKVVKDEALRTEDRQAAYALIIGQTRRERISGKQMKDFINAFHKIDPNTPYGKLSSALSGLWGNLNFRVTADERRAMREREKAKEKGRREKDREDKKAAKNVDVD